MTELHLHALTEQLTSIWRTVLPTSPRLIEVSKQMTADNLAHLESVKEKHNWEEVALTIDGQKYYILGENTNMDLIEEYLQRISMKALEITIRHFGSCHEAAESLRKVDPKNSSLLSNASWSGFSEKPINFPNLGNHTIFSKNLGTQWVAIDLTARFYIDLWGQKMDVLILSAQSIEELKEMVSEVYGDNWYQEEVARLEVK
jgi:hypothetical protein